MLHVGAASPGLPGAYHDNGHPRPKDWLGGGENLRAKDYLALAFAPQNFLCALALDGVFDRFPTLRGGVIELGAGWAPEFLRRLDQAWKGWRKTDPVVGSLSRPPSELIRRAVRFTPFATEDAGAIIRDAGEDLFMFSFDSSAPLKARATRSSASRPVSLRSASHSAKKPAIVSIAATSRTCSLGDVRSVFRGRAVTIGASLTARARRRRRPSSSQALRRPFG